jgi:hypothetical protein
MNSYNVMSIELPDSVAFAVIKYSCLDTEHFVVCQLALAKPESAGPKWRQAIQAHKNPLTLEKVLKPTVSLLGSAALGTPTPLRAVKIARADAHDVHSLFDLFQNGLRICFH